MGVHKVLCENANAWKCYYAVFLAGQYPANKLKFCIPNFYVILPNAIKYTELS